ncbi:hypothetical protein WN67_19335 [Mycolicibacterium obuense]|uniref:Uncharacterized protein n=1 Tax=Mycolicibacterium obuense TaxID=1807 RepID=A0A0M2JZL5_9MYCO|nr:hypothetical protein WN67_19335 [Mycolicibacterium obuense]
MSLKALSEFRGKHGPFWRFVTIRPAKRILQVTLLHLRSVGRTPPRVGVKMERLQSLVSSARTKPITRYASGTRHQIDCVNSSTVDINLNSRLVANRQTLCRFLDSLTRNVQFGAILECQHDVR